MPTKIRSPEEPSRTDGEMQLRQYELFRSCECDSDGRIKTRERKRVRTYNTRKFPKENGATTASSDQTSNWTMISASEMNCTMLRINVAPSEANCIESQPNLQCFEALPQALAGKCEIKGGMSFGSPLLRSRTKGWVIGHCQNQLVNDSELRVGNGIRNVRDTMYNGKLQCVR
jgi:hypothetical protein